MTPLPVEQRLIGVFTPKATAVMTNVPGPRRAGLLRGHAASPGVLGWVPAGGEIGMGVSIFSYAGGVTVGLQVDAGLVPDPETIIAAFGEELAALGRIADQGGTRRERAPARPPPSRRRSRYDQARALHRRQAREAAEAIGID